MEQVKFCIKIKRVFEVIFWVLLILGVVIAPWMYGFAKALYWFVDLL